MNKRFAMLRLPCSALRILKRLQHNNQVLIVYNKMVIHHLVSIHIYNIVSSYYLPKSLLNISATSLVTGLGSSIVRCNWSLLIGIGSCVLLVFIDFGLMICEYY
ncbi:MAG: hypothetical protein LBH59_01485 [Planctomycetaceae bacterium]|nr:hypothetical protein [Planctomycetaceae bacterium]